MNKNYSRQTYTVLAIFILFLSHSTNAQVGIGNTNPAESSLLDVHTTANDKGILIPRVDIADLATKAPITTTTIDESLLVYNTNTTTGKGFYYWSGTQWILLQASGNEKNIYNLNGNLTGNRTLGLNGNSLNINSGASVALQIDNNRRITLGGYGGSTFAGNPVNLLGVNGSGQMVTLDSASSFLAANSDWFKENTVAPPTNINDNIYTNGEVGININNPNAPLHIYETAGTPASANDGTMILEHGDIGGISSIVFKSRVNAGSDYAYISYDDNGSGNGTGTENSLLEIGTQNDTPTGYAAGVDDINIASSGSVGISNIAPDGSSSLDLGATNRGLLINRVALTSTTAVAPVNSPATGLLVYNTATAGASPNNVLPGFYYWNGTKWLKLTAGDEKNIYNTNGVLTSARTLNLNGNNFTISAGALAAFQVSTGRVITLGSYGLGNNIGTGTYNLAVDATGKVVEETVNSGVQYYSYDIASQASPDMQTIIFNTQISKSGTYAGDLDSTNALTTMNPTTDNDGFVIKITGTYKVKNAGNFTFSEITDDGARIYVDGALVLNQWVDSAVGAANTATVNLAKGKHKIEFWYYENTGGQSFTFNWGTNPDGNTGVIKATQFTIE